MGSDGPDRIVADSEEEERGEPNLSWGRAVEDRRPGGRVSYVLC